MDSSDNGQALTVPGRKAKKWNYRHALTVPIRETVKEVDSNTWLVGSLILHRSIGHSDTATWFDDEENSSYTITTAPNPPPPATIMKSNLTSSKEGPFPLPPAGSIKGDQNPIVHTQDIVDECAVWAIGNKAVLKVFMIYSPDNSSPEDVTLNWIRQKRPDFQVPHVIHSCIHDSRLIMFTTRLPGRPLSDVWSSLNEERKDFYVKAVADICKSMAELKWDKICQADGSYLLDEWCLCGEADDNSPAAYEKSAKKLGMDCSDICFMNCYLAPENIFVDDDRIGISDWQLAGYHPRGWLRTRFIHDGDMLLPEGADENQRRYALSLYKVLETYGFENHVQQYRDDHFRRHPR